jgi:hypothetical protein
MTIESRPPDTVRGAFVLTPAAGKKLIGRAVADMPEVRRAYEKGRLVVANGTTTAYVVEALTGETVRKFNYCIGMIADGMFAHNVPDDRDKMYMWKNGERVSGALADFIKEFEPGDVFVKGANAVDPAGFAGGLQANPDGGSWGDVMGVLTARGVTCIVPVGQEKMIPSIPDAARKLGQFRITYSLGSPVGLCPIVSATIITEIEAFELLTGVKAWVVAAGGIGGNEGARSFVVEGSDTQVRQAFEMVKEVRDEPSTALAGEVAASPYKLP